MSKTRELARQAGLLLAAVLLGASATVSAQTAQAPQTEPLSATCTVVINEYSAAKQKSLVDEDGDSGDWVELYNCTDAPISLQGWALSDSARNPLKWFFPDVSIDAGSYVLVWASGKDRRVPAAPLHTSFSLNADGEPLLLSDRSGKVVDSAAALKTRSGQTLGRLPDGGGNWHYFALATPGAANADTGVQAGVAGPPRFSHAGGFHAEAFELALSHETPGAKIYYTLDGSEPDPDNLGGSTYRYKNSYGKTPPQPGDFQHNEYRTLEYTAPIHIRDRRYEPDRLARVSTTLDIVPDYLPGPVQIDDWLNRLIGRVNYLIGKINREANRMVRKYYEMTTGEKRPLGGRKFIPEIPLRYKTPVEHLYKGTPVRAMAVLPDGTASRVATRAYFIGSLNDFTLPVAHISVPDKTLVDYDEGMFVPGVDYDDWLGSPEADQNISRGSRPANWRRSGVRPPAHLTIFDPEHPGGVGSEIDISPHGGWTRILANKSIRAYSKAEKGIDGFAYDFFQNEGAARRVVFRNAGQANDSTYLTDAVIHQIMKGLNFGTQGYRAVVLFINGEYYGIRNVRERLDRYYLAREYQLPSFDVDILEKNAEVEQGSRAKWDEVLALTESLQQEGDPAWAALQAHVDIDSFIDYYAAQIFVGNIDWPGNNISFWRYQKETQSPQPAATQLYTDGRWRWLMFDTDQACGNGHEHDTLAFATVPGGTVWPNPDWSTFMLRSLLAVPEFRTRFIVRFSDLMNSHFLPERTVGVLRSMQAAIAPEMPRHIHRWSAPASLGHWEKELDELAECLTKRPAQQRQHLQNHFNLGQLHGLEISQSPADGGTVKLNTLVLAENAESSGAQVMAMPWQGKYFQDTPLSIKAEARPGYRFSHWQAEGVELKNPESPALKIQLPRDASLRAVFVQASR